MIHENLGTTKGIGYMMMSYSNGKDKCTYMDLVALDKRIPKILL